VIKDLLRKYPERYEEVIPAMQKCLKSIEETEGKVAVIWMIGEYGDTINEAPYILEPLIDNFDDEPSSAVRMELLTATMKLFFKRPPELQAMLGRLLSKAVLDVAKIDVRDRALLYYRLLSFDVHEAARIVNCSKNIVDSFVESEDTDLKEKIFAEFNTLSVVYDVPAEKFLAATKNKDESLLQTTITNNPPPTPTPSSSEPMLQNDQKEVNILDNLLDLMPSLEGGPSSASVGLQLESGVTVDAVTFQSRWAALSVSWTVELTLRPNPSGYQQIEQLMGRHSIYTLASGTLQNQMKFYFFAKQVKTDALFLIEAVIDLSTYKLTAAIKADSSESSSLLANTFKEALISLL